MNLNKIVIVLSNPDESRNIGAVCRTMANNSLYDLRIVGKKNNYNDNNGSRNGRFVFTETDPRILEIAYGLIVKLFIA